MTDKYIVFLRVISIGALQFLTKYSKLAIFGCVFLKKKKKKKNPLRCSCIMQMDSNHFLFNLPLNHRGSIFGGRT
jgi:hypothetical protein